MVESKRLIIIPLSSNQLLKYIKLDGSLESELNLVPLTRTISPELKDALEQDILPRVSDSTKKFIYSTLWTIVLKEKNIMVGDLCFMGEPNDLDEIEIGYGIYENFRGNGFMKEAVHAIISWAKHQDGVKSITAKTEKSNIASFTILEKNDFVKVSETDNLYCWNLRIV